MAYNYDALYGATKDALGPPTDVIVAFFDDYGNERARVLDVGCGQGRDALFIARRGHRVTGVDLSPNGISDLSAVAEKESLPIEAIVADITTFVPSGAFDIILIDRTLHMLKKAEARSVLARLCRHVTADGWVLIADETSNIEGFEAVLADADENWKTVMKKKGYLFAHRV